jgi:hypothetical protein
MIHCAAGEILYQIDQLKDCAENQIEFHVLQIEKASLFIQFVEDIYIIPGTETIEDAQLKDIWETIQWPNYTYAAASDAPIWKPIIAKIKEYQKKIKGKFLTISPF